MQISIIWEPNEAKSLHRLWQGRDPPGISQGENHLTTFDPYDLKYIGSYLREDLFHLTRPTGYNVAEGEKTENSLEPLMSSHCKRGDYEIWSFPALDCKRPQ